MVFRIHAIEIPEVSERVIDLPILFVTEVDEPTTALMTLLNPLFRVMATELVEVTEIVWKNCLIP